MTFRPGGPILPVIVTDLVPSDPPGGVAAALGTLRHALAEPLSAAGLKLELLERRLATVPPNGATLVDRVRGAKADLAAAGRLIDLLPRLANIAEQAPAEASIGDLCRVAGVPVEEDAASRHPLLIRRLASLDALRFVVSFLQSRDTGGTPLGIRVDADPERVSLRLEVSGGCGEANPERLFQLPHGQERAEELFLARAGVESDGGRLDLSEKEGRLVALLSWPRPASTSERKVPE